MAFQFKEFSINDDLCGMKVGADSVLLGAWVHIGNVKNALDVGCGSGLLSLMLAQRSAAWVTGVEIDVAAVGQAQQNVASSPFARRITIIEADVRTFSGGPFDCIVCNPPYFAPTHFIKEQTRHLARCTSSLTRTELLVATKALLADDGRFAVVLPYSQADDFAFEAWEHDLFLVRRLDVITRTGKPPKRSLLEFVRHPETLSRDVLSLESEAYRELVSPFYLNGP